MSEHEDLEDGEIEDDEEEDVPVGLLNESIQEGKSQEHSSSGPDHPPSENLSTSAEDRLREINDKVQTVKNLIEGKARLLDDAPPPKSSKRSKPGPVVDDWATSVENAIASALIKDGVQPPMPALSNRHDDEDGEAQPKRRRREKSKKKSQPEKTEEMEEIDLEYEMLNVRGGSPRPQHLPDARPMRDRSESEDSYSSDDSRDRRDRDHRDRRDRERERDREYNRRKRKNRPRNRNQRDSRKRKRDDSDDDRHHRNNGPRKMELCKFYLMDCCAKREKCLYMHSDFPCKYYYLGLKCKEKEKCLFSHGEPLTNELKAILLKHLESAPQEILGDFPRISRDSATTMVNATHRKLLEKHGMTDKTTEDDKNAGESKIPSLLEMMSRDDRSAKNRRSRWCDKNTDNMNVFGNGGEFLSLKYLDGVISHEQIANLEQMGIQNIDQISQLTVAQLNELGLNISQIHELQLNAMNMKKLRENMGKPVNQTEDEANEGSTSSTSLTHSKDQDMRITPSHVPLQSESSDLSALGGKDVDMRFLPLVKSEQTDNGSHQDECLELVSNSLTGLIKTPTVDYSQYLKDSNLDDDDYDNSENPDKLMIAHDDDDDDEENNLKISLDDEDYDDKPAEKIRSEKEDKFQNKFSSSPQPAVFDSRFNNRSLSTTKIEYSKPFDIYKSLDDEDFWDEEKPSTSCIQDNLPVKNEPAVSTKAKNDVFSRKSMYSNIEASQDSAGEHSPSPTHKPFGSPNNNPPTSTLGWTPNSGNISTPAVSSSSVPKVSTKPARPSIYDDPGGYDNSDDSDSESKPTSMYAERDKDMRLNFLNLEDKMGEDGLSNSDVDLRLPFKPIMTNYIPATEIDASITSHAPIVYKVHEVDIPKPNYKDIRRNTPRPERTKDPRLRRIFGMPSEDQSNESNKFDTLFSGMRSPKSSQGTSSQTLPSASVPIAPRVDPRKRNLEAKAQAAGQNDINGMGSCGQPNSSLDVQTILQRSTWYTDLSSKHKIMVNQQLAILSTEMKKFHNSDKSTDKLADFMQQVAANQLLQFILSNLNVYVDDSVQFCDVPLVTSQPPPLMSVPPPNIGMPPMNLLPPVNLPAPGNKPPSLFDLPRFNCPPEVRPGLLGVAPNMPFEQFLAMGQVNKGNPPSLLDDWGDHWDEEGPVGGPGGPGGPGGFVPNFERNHNNFSNPRNNNAMRNNNRGGHNFRNNDRWNNAGGPNRRNNNNHRRMDKKK
ncbi:protein suppressor of sable-like [Uranotaenia lowii]|uniref:protein suppressor of sable-like n=1 Tax=Uranotaenia lowii TaxID=190385 RepID=UPI002479A0F6|nr:protein suppressor of sable-like [Uranotaenia lowii]XP_055597316.1 protein suppressor of sable-like [Uranotaenia lowii]XP_055597318.1 protein suppressor of sable-like [Uranotaenia lowii]XP_055597319.1 protein suppressor of sable-like [Uranotaenia lowii]XP_055597320.1 protein suppressor of sable-like [Uranotaenia lowii]